MKKARYGPCNSSAREADPLGLLNSQSSLHDSLRAGDRFCLKQGRQHVTFASMCACTHINLSPNTLSIYGEETENNKLPDGNIEK